MISPTADGGLCDGSPYAVVMEILRVVEIAAIRRPCPHLFGPSVVRRRGGVSHRQQVLSLETTNLPSFFLRQHTDVEHGI
jgi:hypothetical protein